MNTLDKDLLSVQEVRQTVERAKAAQAVFAEYSQEKIDAVVEAMSLAAEQEAVSLAKAAKAETGFGRWEDKVVKNTFASRTVCNAIRDMKTVGVIQENSQQRVLDIGVPIGVIAGLIPSTNPTSTVIYKALISLKSGNAIVFSPHPSAKACIWRTADILHTAAVAAGAPENIISCLTIPTLEGTTELMRHRDVNLILATGGEAMVRAAYSSGKPAIGVGPGNSPAFIERSADIPKAIHRIIQSKTFDNGVICASEQSIVVEQDIEHEVKKEFCKQGGYFLNSCESEQLSRFLLRPNMTINPQVVGKSAQELAVAVGLHIPSDTKVLISLQNTVSHANPYSREKLTPVLAFYVERDWEAACLRCLELLQNEGKGHTLNIHSQNEAIIREFALKKKVSRVLVNTPSALGAIGATTGLFPALTLGCGAVGGSSTSDNVGPMNLINIRRLAYGNCEVEDLNGEAPEPTAVQTQAISAGGHLVDQILNLL